MKLPILATEYYLTKSGTIASKETTITSIPRNHTILKTLFTAICGSDIQYFKGEKSKEKLESRPPLIPLHEGVCLDMKTGKRVIPIAGDFRKVPYTFFQKENTWPALPYLGSTMPGLARTYFTYPRELLIAVPKSVPDHVASIVEPLTVALKSVTDMNIHKNEKIAIIGTGGLAFLVAVVLRFFTKIPKKNLFIFGINDNKLKSFSTIAQTVNYTENIEKYHHIFPKIFEAVGRKNMDLTLNTALELVEPGGTIGILGISDTPWTLPVERLVNWQVTIKGLTRSTPAEYPRTMRFLQKPEISSVINKHLVSTHLFPVANEKDIENAFIFADTSKAIGRIILQWI